MFLAATIQPALAPAAPQLDPTQAASQIQGAWCAQGDDIKHCSISANGPFLTFTNENGSTSSGNFVGMGGNTVSADQWNFVRGQISADKRRIDWSNGTYWTRYGGGNGGGGNRKPNLSGTWYTNGNRSMSCSISQRKKNLNLTNESGATATGFISGDRSITTYWSGNRIDGTISLDGNTIYWNNGTTWSR